MVGQVGVGGEFSAVTATATDNSTRVDVRALANDVKVILGKTEQTAVIPKEQVEKIVGGMNDFLKASPHSNLKFEFHEELNEYYVTIVDDITNEVIKEIPPKKMLDMFAAMTEFLGLMVDKKI
ncbi:flagellar protein FlaG [Lederbergia lenta]|uniref:Flagellar protein FlaG n=1 Tax=Lederbergia lenta TaxID=1467 RepID=A0A2X4WFE4_LEDLE|nr:flagellar protein FlaG [Lederbergia lenta]MCM3113114.1 flagellar protein FlaG [Lederbergia lenta]MEC2322842.1 flagellar protein FlaG [Lederbergia lenta]SQI61911.1 flagellar protein FlaG [Lederbergia lenta]